MTHPTPTTVKRMRLASLPVALLTTTLLASTAPSTSHAQPRDAFSVCWSIYAGWMPWAYADVEGIVDKWADEYDITIDVVQVNDYSNGNGDIVLKGSDSLADIAGRRVNRSFAYPQW